MKATSHNLSKIILLSILLLIMQLNVSGQDNNTVSSTVHQLIQEARKGIGVTLKDTILSGKTGKEKKVKLLNELENYSNDPSDFIRLTTISLMYEVAEVSDDADTNQDVVNILSQKITDPSLLVSSSAVKLLSRFKKEHFNSSAKAAIMGGFKKNNSPDLAIIKLLGVAGVESSIVDLKKLVKEHSKEDSLPKVGKWYGKLTWGAYLALARMGDRSALDYVIHRVDSEQDEVIKVTQLLKDIAYTRQPGGADYIEKYLFSEERLSAACGGDQGPRVSGYAVYNLAGMIEDFPLPYRPGYSDKEIELARTWMRANSNYKITK